MATFIEKLVVVGLVLIGLLIAWLDSRSDRRKRPIKGPTKADEMSFDAQAMNKIRRTFRLW
jgi:hypothetical protein